MASVYAEGKISMADDKTTATTDAPAATPEAAPTPAPKAAGLITYVVKNNLEHDGVAYAPGASFQHPDPAVIKALRAANAIALQTEVQAADEVAARIAALEAALAEAQQLNASLTQQQSVNSKGGK